MTEQQEIEDWSKLDLLYRKKGRHPVFMLGDGGKYIYHKCKGGTTLFIDWSVAICPMCKEVWSGMEKAT